eukprot:COSAG05_NODE_8754_length_674_cov_9.915912_2_plen_57_part_00
MRDACEDLGHKYLKADIMQNLALLYLVFIYYVILPAKPFSKSASDKAWHMCVFLCA